MSKITCDYCQKEFINIYILKNHQKTAKYCLVLQGKINKKELKCEICEKILSSKQNFDNHTIKCKLKKNIFNCQYCDKILSSKSDATTGLFASYVVNT